MTIPYELERAIGTENGLTALAQIVPQSIQVHAGPAGSCLITVTRGIEEPIRFRLNDSARLAFIALLEGSCHA